MSLISYTNPPKFTIRNLAAPRKKLTGTCHGNPAWTLAVRVLRASLLAALASAPERKASSETVGLQLIDNLNVLDSRALHVLAVATAVLIRSAK
jgi:hypothetical protein